MTVRSPPLVDAEVIVDASPPIVEVDTPNISFESDSNSINSGLDNSLYGSNLHDSHCSQNEDTANSILKDIRVKNVNRLTIGTLNINSIPSKFDQLKEVIGNHLDVFTIQETKIDESFPEDQFEIKGYHKPYRLDRNIHGGGGFDLCEGRYSH